MLCMLPLLFASAGEAEELYEEDLTSSMPIREQQWKQMEAYVQSLGDAAAKQPLYPADFSSLNAYSKSMQPLHRLLADRVGFPPPALFPTVKERLEQVGEDEVARYYRCYIPIAPELESYGLYIVPKKAHFPAPLVISMHGGGGTPEMATFHGGTNYHDMVRGAVARGYVVFAPLHIFNPFSDKEKNSPIPPNIRYQLDQRLRVLGTSLTAVEVAKISRALDALLKRPEVDPKRVAMIGLSYGGFYTLYTTALEPRIKCAVSACFFNDETSRLSYDRPAAWNDMRFQGTASVLANSELAALICPRPLQVQCGKKDDLFPLAGAEKAAARASQYYAKLGLADRFQLDAFDGGHEFHGEAAWEFLKRWL